MMKLRRRAAPEHPAEANLPRGGRQKIFTSNHEIDALIEVVDDHRELIRPISERDRERADRRIDLRVTAFAHRAVRRGTFPCHHSCARGARAWSRMRARVHGTARDSASPCRTDPARPSRCRGASSRTHIRVPRLQVPRAPRRSARCAQPNSAVPRSNPARSRASRDLPGFASAYSSRHRVRSWSSRRRITRPPRSRAIPHTCSALTTWPRCSHPVGAGAKRVTGPTDPCATSS